MKSKLILICCAMKFDRHVSKWNFNFIHLYPKKEIGKDTMMMNNWNFSGSVKFHFLSKYFPSLNSNFSSATKSDKKLCSCWSDLSYAGSAMQNICSQHVSSHLICLVAHARVRCTVNQSVTLRVL